MNILHTADWHLGQLFYEYDRTYEHQQFLDWLVQTLQREAVDVLLVSGDVFDLANPSAATIRQFYLFLNRAIKACPDLHIVIIAGNHDSASRLESPKPLLESSNIHIVGLVEKDDVGMIDYDKLLIPLIKEGDVKAWCMAIPFLRAGDYPVVSNAENPYVEGVTALYQAVYEAAKRLQQPGQALVAMGHLHAGGAATSDLDKFERLIMGGVECVAASAFPDELAYVALGHIHKAQRLGGKDHIRYAGSPIPMSFSEINYKHQVVVFSVEGEKITSPRAIEVPVTVPLLKVPKVHSPLEEVLAALHRLPVYTDADRDTAPYLQVSVLLDSPEPGLRHKIQQALVGKHVRLARIDTRYPNKKATDGDGELRGSMDPLQTLNPVDVFKQLYESRYTGKVPVELMKLFNDIAQQVAESEGEER